jgi:hypothetical protein
MEPSEEYVKMGAREPVLLIPLFNLAKKLPEHLHNKNFSVNRDLAGNKIVISFGTVTIREDYDVFPSDTLITQMILVLS